MTATRPMKGISVKELYTYKVPSSTEWAFNQLEKIFHPNVYIDISNTIDTKLKAIKMYDA